MGGVEVEWESSPNNEFEPIRMTSSFAAQLNVMSTPPAQVV